MIEIIKPLVTVALSARRGIACTCIPAEVEIVLKVQRRISCVEHLYARGAPDLLCCYMEKVGGSTATNNCDVILVD